jgi:hypothetical protein
LLGTPDIAGLPADAFFSATAILRNTTAAALTISPVYGFDKNGVPESVVLPAIQLAANQAMAFDLQEMLEKAGVKARAINSGLTLNYSGAPGSLIAHITSLDQTRGFVFDIPVKDPMMEMNRRSGYYP